MKGYIRAHQVFRAQLFFQILLQERTVDSAKDIQEWFQNFWRSILSAYLKNYLEIFGIQNYRILSNWMDFPKVPVLTWHGNLVSGSLSESVPAGADLQISFTRAYK